MYLPATQPQEAFSEDVRADAAPTVFANYWENARAFVLRNIEAMAVQFADTGEYPYQAFASICCRFQELYRDYDSRYERLSWGLPSQAMRPWH